MQELQTLITQVITNLPIGYRQMRANGINTALLEQSNLLSLIEGRAMSAVDQLESWTKINHDLLNTNLVRFITPSPLVSLWVEG